MSFREFTPPPLTKWLENVAGILPLYVLIEFINAPMALHMHELTGQSSFWHWPISPAGARIFLQAKDTGVCWLDDETSARVPLCLDTKWGDQYPCTSPHTTQLCTSSADRIRTITTDAAKRWKVHPSGRRRPVILDIIRVTLLPEPTVIKLSSDLSRWPGQFIALYRRENVLRRFMSSYFGWFIWTGLFTAGVMCRFYFAAGYLGFIILTGALVRNIYGHRMRRLANTCNNNYRRLVVMIENMNRLHWVGYHGGHKLVDSLLNKPILSQDVFPQNIYTRCLLGSFILGQWACAILASAHQGWDAIIIAFWITYCALVSAFVYAPSHIIKDWLAFNNIRLEKVEVELSSRRAMLSTLVALNSDRKGNMGLSMDSKGQLTSRSTKWVDPILAHSESRDNWEEVLYLALDNDYTMPDQKRYWGKGSDMNSLPDWWPAVEEALEAVQRLNAIPWHGDPNEDLKNSSDAL